MVWKLDSLVPFCVHFLLWMSILSYSLQISSRACFLSNQFLGSKFLSSLFSLINLCNIFSSSSCRKPFFWLQIYHLELYFCRFPYLLASLIIAIAALFVIPICFFLPVCSHVHLSTRLWCIHTSATQFANLLVNRESKLI